MDSENKLSEKTLITAILTIVAIEFLFAFIFGYTSIPDIPKVAVIRVVQVAALITIVILLNNGLSAIGLSKGSLLKGLKKGMLWAAAFGSITGASFVLLFFSGINPFEFFHQEQSVTMIDLVILFIVGGVIGPVAEEVFFRGFIYGFFREWGVVFGIIASTVIFAALHFKGGGLPYIQMAGGLVFAVSYEAEKSLIVPVVIHVTGNIALFTISLV